MFIKSTINLYHRISIHKFKNLFIYHSYVKLATLHIFHFIVPFKMFNIGSNEEYVLRSPFPVNPVSYSTHITLFTNGNSFYKSLRCCLHFAFIFFLLIYTV